MVRGWKTYYLEELGRKKENGKNLQVKTLSSAKTGRPLNLGADLDNKSNLISWSHVKEEVRSRQTSL